MREIRFRAKTVKGSQWIEGDLFHAGTEPSDGEFAISYWDEDSGWMYENVRPDTIGQLTGVKDKSGTDIYEGDIVECVSWNEYFTNPKTGEVMQPFRRRMYVDFRKAAESRLNHSGVGCTSVSARAASRWWSRCQSR